MGLRWRLRVMLTIVSPDWLIDYTLSIQQLRWWHNARIFQDVLEVLQCITLLFFVNSASKYVFVNNRFHSTYECLNVWTWEDFLVLEKNQCVATGQSICYMIAGRSGNRYNLLYAPSGIRAKPSLEWAKHLNQNQYESIQDAFCRSLSGYV